MYSMDGLKLCLADNSSKLIGKKFTILTVHNIMSNHTRFNQYIDIDFIKGINLKILSTRLKEMEKDPIAASYEV
jgi:DNA-binding HxlR family transcriptional regulator